MKFTSVIGIFMSAILVVVVMTTMAISFFGMTSSVSIVERNFECERVWHAPGERNVVLRIDDIQAFAWRETQMKMVEDALERNMTLVLGVIPGISGGIFEDVGISNFLIRNRCKVEIAIHGYKHNYKEFENFSFDEARVRVRKSLDILNLIEEDIVSFIPPDNVISDESYAALSFYEIDIVSAGYGSGKYGFSSSTYDWENKKLELVDVVLEQCRDALDKFGLCVIMFHPQDYVDNESHHDSEKYDEYLALLDGVAELDAEVVTFRDLDLEGIVFLN